MINKILSLSKELISIKSTPNNLKALEKSLEIAVSKLTGYAIERFENKGIKSVLVSNSKKRPKRFKIILNGHLDVIPGKDYQYVPKIIRDRLYGVGAMDMKANAACLITVFKEVAKKVKYPLGLQLVTDEETGGFNGTKYQIDKGVRADFVIAGETTNFKIVNKAKGILWVKISTRGKTAHAAYPWKGENAIWKMNKFLALLGKKYPIPDQEDWVTTVNLSKIETSNQTFNKIPDDCEVWLDIRYIPQETNTIVNHLKEMMPLGFKLDILEKEPALLVDENNQFIRMLQKTAGRITKKKVVLYGAQGSSDARHFTKMNCDGIEFGPIGGGIGSDKEWIDIPGLVIYFQILKNFLISI